MNSEFLIAADNSILRARVERVDEAGVVVLPFDSGGSNRVVCDVLETASEMQLQLIPGDIVLVWQRGEPGARGVILGRITPAKSPRNAKTDMPDQLVLEARQQLVFRCGDGCITIRADGKILIEGKDLVSRALRTNRIKGGAVSIN